MSTLVKTNVSGYYKDSTSGVVINMNEDEYRSYVNQKNQWKEYRATLDQVSELKKELEEMKKLFMEKIQNNG